jgi:hypothetical protein
MPPRNIDDFCFGGETGLQTICMRMTAILSPNESNEEDKTACLDFLVSLLTESEPFYFFLSTVRKVLEVVDSNDNLLLKSAIENCAISLPYLQLIPLWPER